MNSDLPHSPSPSDTASAQLRFSCPHCAQKLDATGLPPFEHSTCPNCNQDIIIPKWFGNYLLEEPVGKGGMATVYRAIELTLNREVAIKILNADLTQADGNDNLFLHEARTAATVIHRSVIPVYTCGVEEGNTFISMQFMHGGSLDDRIRDAKDMLPVSRVTQWMCDVAEGLRNAARNSIVHHDIKPGNIMLDHDDNAHIGDFGIANSIRPDGENMEEIIKTINSFITPNYVSPEKIQGLGEDSRGDIYSLGATFFHLLTLRPPFIHDDVYEVARMRLSFAPPVVKELRPDVPQAISDLILKMMSVDPNQRPSYDEIIETLNNELVLVHGSQLSMVTPDAVSALKATYIIRAVVTLILMLIAGYAAYAITLHFI